MNIKSEVKRIENRISEVTKLFYQDKIQEGYRSLEELLGMLSIFVEGAYREGVLKDADNEVLNVLKGIMEAMEAKDTLLVADMLEYDLKEALQRLE